MPYGCRFFIASITQRWLNAWLPVMVMFPTLTLGPSLTLKISASDDGRNLLDLRVYRGVLAAALRKKVLQNVGGVLDSGRVVLRLDYQADFAFLEAVEDFGFRYGMDSAVVNGADDAALGNDEGDFDGIGPLARFHFQADIVEAARVPESHEVTPEELFVVNIAGFGYQQGFEGFGWGAARPAHINRIDKLLARP